MDTAASKYAEALAHDIADALNIAPQAAGRVAVYFDRDAETWAVRVTVNAWQRYDLLMPAPGALYALFRNERWIGGMSLRSDAAPVDVAAALLARLAQAVR